MDKNTIWAIVLSTIVIIGAYLVYPLVMGKKNADVEPVSTEEVVETTTETTEVAELSDVIYAENAEEVEEVADEVYEEKLVEFNTENVAVTFTTKGGDILSYKLINHKDTDTNDGVQISDSVTNRNRTLALSLGGASNSIIDDVFDVQQNGNEILFTKKITKDGKSFILGKKYTFDPKEYMFKFEVMVHGAKSGLNYDGVAYTVRTSPQIGPHYDPKQNRYENRQFISFDGSKVKKQILGSNQYKKYEKTCVWGGIAGKYFEELVIPADSGIWSGIYYSSNIEIDDYANAQAFFERRSFGESDIKDTYYMYFGPRNEKDLKIYNVPENNVWNKGGLKLTSSLQTSGFLSWLETILKWALELLHKFIFNWGICIIVLTVILKLLMFPLSQKQSMSTLKMQELQPKLQAIQSKYKDDQQKLQQETSKLYQEAGYNPASGCLPLIFQFLILISMYNLFNNYFEFRGASFIPNWIPDLTAGDSVYKFNFNIPLLGNQLRLLPIIYVISQILFSIITQNGGATAGQANNSMNMKFMTYGMPFLFFFLFYNAPSGLLIYWIVSNVFQLGQQLIINKMMANKKAEMAVSKNNTGKSNKSKK